MDDYTAYITVHCKRRSKERLGLNKQAIQRKANIALEFGIRHDEATGHLSRFMDKVFLTNTTATNLRVYHGFIYIFSGNTLITLFSLPKPLIKVASQQQEIKGDRPKRANKKFKGEG